MNQDVDSWLKLIAVWVGTVIGGLTLSKLVLFVTLIYTILQTYVLWRDKVRKRCPAPRGRK